MQYLSNHLIYSCYVQGTLPLTIRASPTPVPKGYKRLRRPLTLLHLIGDIHQLLLVRGQTVCRRKRPATPRNISYSISGAPPIGYPSVAWQAEDWSPSSFTLDHHPSEPRFSEARGHASDSCRDAAEFQEPKSARACPPLNLALHIPLAKGGSSEYDGRQSQEETQALEILGCHNLLASA